MPAYKDAVALVIFMIVILFKPQGLNLTIGYAGQKSLEIFGVIGLNGSGKTTMPNSVLGQISPDAGAIELHGKTITGLSPLDGGHRFLKRPCPLWR